MRTFSVSAITLVGVTGPDEIPRKLRRRRWPVLALIATLFVAASIIWFQAIKPPVKLSHACNEPGPAPRTSAETSRTRTTEATATGSQTPAAATATSSPSSSVPVNTTLGTYLDKNTLRDTRPANPEVLQVNVFNASNKTGMGKTLSDELRRIGFKSVSKAANDPIYLAHDLRCQGQIRYGQAGLAGARTMLMIIPCAQLVMDGRVDDSVDVAVGALYAPGEISEEVRKQLSEIVVAARPPAIIEGRTAAPRTLPAIPPLPGANCPS